ncbi:MAG: DUF664 domain-containing protein [Anaerolineales bacterium]|nr:DUF664 domain-containing protein [Anaerolineales bacterium]
MNAAQFFDHWNTVHRDFMRAVALLEDEDLAYLPSPAYSRTIGGILRHVINLENGWIHYVIRRALPEWPDEREEELNSVEVLRKELDRTFDETMDYLKTIPVDDFNRIVQVPNDGIPKLGWILWHVFEQKIHHRGEIFLCLSLLGKPRPTIDRPE